MQNSTIATFKENEPPSFLQLLFYLLHVNIMPLSVSRPANLWAPSGGYHIFIFLNYNN